MPHFRTSWHRAGAALVRLLRHGFTLYGFSERTVADELRQPGNVAFPLTGPFDVTRWAPTSLHERRFVLRVLEGRDGHAQRRVALRLERAHHAVSGTDEPVYAPLVAHNGFAHSWAWVDRTRAFILGDWDTPQFAGRFFWLSVGG